MNKQLEETQFMINNIETRIKEDNISLVVAEEKYKESLTQVRLNKENGKTLYCYGVDCNYCPLFKYFERDCESYEVSLRHDAKLYIPMFETAIEAVFCPYQEEVEL